MKGGDEGGVGVKKKKVFCSCRDLGIKSESLDVPSCCVHHWAKHIIWSLMFV